MLRGTGPADGTGRGSAGGASSSHVSVEAAAPPQGLLALPSLSAQRHVASSALVSRRVRAPTSFPRSMSLTVLGSSQSVSEVV